MSSAHNAPYGLGCWHSVNGRSHWKSSLVFKDLEMTLQICHLSLTCPELLVKSLETYYGITDPNSCTAKTAQQLLPTERQWEIRNLKLFMEPQKLFSWCFIWILVFHFRCYSFFRHTISTQFILSLQQIQTQTSYGPLIRTPICNSKASKLLGNSPQTFTVLQLGPDRTEPPSH